MNRDIQKEAIDAVRQTQERAEPRRTRLRCLLCNVVIESTSNHDFKKCECGECCVDGGPRSGRLGGHPNNYFQMPYDDEERNIAWDAKYKALWLADIDKQEQEAEEEKNSMQEMESI